MLQKFMTFKGAQGFYKNMLDDYKTQEKAENQKKKKIK